MINACVMLDLGIVPNCCESIFERTAGLTLVSTTYSSAFFDRIGVWEMGRRYLFMSAQVFAWAPAQHLLLSRRVGDVLRDKMN